MATEENGTMTVKCLLCGNAYKSLNLHVLYKHNITVPEYKSKFPGAPLVSKEVGDKISQALKGHPNWSTDSLTDESRSRMGRKGVARKPFTEEHKRNISESAKERGVWMMQTEDAKCNRRKSLSGKPKSPDHVNNVKKGLARYWARWHEVNECKKAYYNNEYILARKKVLKRDGGKCSLCWTRVALQVHHIDSDTKNNSERNLITLCRSCHGKTRQKDIKLSMRAVMRILLFENYYSCKWGVCG